PLKKQTLHTATVTDKVAEFVTVVDSTHPFFGRTFPLVRSTSARGKQYLVVRLPNGHTRSVPIKATDYEPPQSVPAPIGLLPISARTLLPLARYLRLKSTPLAMEEACNAPSSHFGLDDNITKGSSVASLESITPLGREPDLSRSDHSLTVHPKTGAAHQADPNIDSENPKGEITQ
ncbi:MAG: hypothetical protein L0220_34425, partial [Acidobacteria bacterium]|nr:hypothetical protein [Acidobacteriota bacterium]